MSAGDVRLDPILGTVFVALLFATSRSIQVGFRARERLDKDFGQRRSQARAKLEADVLLPGLARFVDKVRGEMDRVGALAVQPGGDAVEFIQDSLQNVGYLDDIRELSEAATEHGDFQRLSMEAARWGRRKASALLATLASLAFFAMQFGVRNLFTSPDSANWIAGVLLIFSLAVAAVSWNLETSARKRLTELCSKYE